MTMRNELVPPKVEPGQVFGKALHFAKGMLSGPKRADSVIGMLEKRGSAVTSAVRVPDHHIKKSLYRH